MTDQGNFDPARTVEGFRKQRAEEEARKKAEEQRREDQRKGHRDKVLELLRHAERELEETHDPVVSEFATTEWWSTKERISDRRGPKEFKKTLRADQTIVGYKNDSSIWRSRYIYGVATRHERQTRYYGSWLSLHSTDGDGRRIKGLMKLRQPHAGYVYMSIRNVNPHNVSCFDVNENTTNSFQMYKSLEEATEVPLGSVEELTKHVTQALDFVSTGQPPESEWIEPRYEHPGD